MGVTLGNIPADQIEGIATGVIAPRHGYFLGPFMMGFFLDAVFLGMAIQLYIRWHTYSKKEERPVVKGLVWYLMLVGLSGTIYLTAWIFHLFVYGFGKYGNFFRLNWTMWWLILNMACRLPISMFFAHRAWQMVNRNRFYAAFLGLLYVTNFATVIPIKIFYEIQPDLTLILVVVHMGCEAVADIIVTVTIAVFLFRARTEFTSTNQLILRLLLLVAETQLPPTVLSILFLTLFINLDTRPLTNFFPCAPKIYIICLLVVLTSRQKLRVDLSTQQDLPLSTLHEGCRGKSYDPSQGPTLVHVTTETYTQVQRTAIAPKYSVNRGPVSDLDIIHDLEVGVEGEEDKDSFDGAMNTSEVRLTKNKGSE